MLVTCSIGCTSHQSLILYMVAINIYNIMRSNRGTGDPLHYTNLDTPGISITGYTRYTFLHFRNWSVYIYILLREYTGNLFYSCLPPSTRKQVTQPIPRL